MAHIIYPGIILFFALLFTGSSAFSDEFSDTLSRVETLNISRGNYVLGKALTNKQKEIASKHAVRNSTPWTYKFKDQGMAVVAEKTTDRVIILYEQYENASPEKVQKLVSALFLDFGDPTVMAHDKIIYWAYSPKGKLTREQYKNLRKADEELNIIATIKLNSSQGIMEKNTRKASKGNLYYIISSQVALALLKKQDG